VSWQDWTWDPTLFEGAAPYYERGRMPYARGLAEAMAGALGLDGTGRLLDLGCGPGTVTLLLADLFDEVVGLDPDAGMLREARRIFDERGVTNAQWVHERAENLPADLGRFRVATFAASFHWMDRPKVARTVLGMLQLGGAAVHVDAPAYRPPDLIADPGLPHPLPPEDLVIELRRRLLGEDRRAGQGIRNDSPSNEADVFLGAGFVGPQLVVVPDGRILERTVDDLVAQHFSSSSTAPHLFGERQAEFENDLRALLVRASPSGLFSVRLPDNHLIIWRTRQA
jgi:SAM-dependent methyltransferase